MNQSVNPTLNHGRPVIFGEVLFDSFPDGSAVLGGAPFNVAWHLQGFGLHPLLISRVGDDDLGQQIIQTMDKWGMDVQGIQMDDQHPTGTVQVSLTNGQPQFSILPDVAYDFIDKEPLKKTLQDKNISLLYHGSLAIRSRASRDALMALRDAHKIAPLFIDINLRAPWWKHEAIDRILHGATWLKLNDVELTELSHQGYLGDDQLLDAAKVVLDKYGLQLLILTKGDQGANIFSSDDIIHGEPYPVKEIVDTVGAGDAFSAVTLLGLLQGWSLAHTLQCALEFGSLLCSRRGATIQDTGLYRSLLDKWMPADATG